MRMRTTKAAAGAVVLTLAGLTGPLAAQGLNDPNAVDTIIGSPVDEEERSAESDAARVIAAIDKAPETAATVRKTTALDKVDIVFLTDASAAEGGPPPEIERKIEQRKHEVEALRTEVEGNAMLYHAINSRQILMRDVIAVEFDDANGVVIYAAGKPATTGTDR